MPSTVEHVSRALARATERRWLPLVLVSVVIGLDLALHTLPFHPLWSGLLDEPAHLTTTLIVLLGVAPKWVRRAPHLAMVTLLSSALIDLDHLPQYLGADWITAGPDVRPVTHSLATVCTVGLLGIAVPHVRRVAFACSAGVALHLLRDLGTGTGVPLAWPWTSDDLAIGYPVYLGSIAALATLRASLAHRVPPWCDHGENQVV